MAILPANVLLPDSSSGWLSEAIPLVVSQDLATAKSVIPAVVSNQSAVYQSGSNQALHITLEQRAKQLSIEGAVRDVATQRTSRVVAVRGTDLITELNILAKQLDEGATPFSTRNTSALKAFALGISSPNSQVKAQRLADAIASDPSFGLAYVALADTLASASDPDFANVLQNGEAHRNSFTGLDQARFDLLRCRLLHAPLDQQVAAAATLVKVSPNDTQGLATLASGLFLQGNAAEGERLLNRAVAISPENGELRQQLATGLIETRQFVKAEKVLDSLAKDPAIQPQLAFCIWFEGDAARANAVFDKFLNSVPSPDVKFFLRASWQSLTGHRREAIEALANAHFTDQRFVTLAKNQQVLWLLMDKRYQEARVASVGAGPVAALLASGATSSGEWISKVDATADTKSRDALKAYGLFLYSFYAPAADAWKALNAASGGTDLPARTMFAAALKLSGRTGEESKILVQPFIPNFSDYYSAVSFAQLNMLLGHAE